VTPPDVESVCVTALGMVASLGFEVETACAAARAGITRAAEVDYFPLGTGEDGDAIPAVGHPIPEITSGFEGRARLLRIAQAGFADLLRHMTQPPASHELPFYLAVPDWRRTEAPLVTEDAQASDASTTAVEEEEPEPDDSLAWLRTALALQRWPVRPKFAFLACGHTVVLEALVAAIADLRERRVRQAVVGGVDSLLEHRTLRWLHGDLRLKGPGLAAGLLPGEAAAFCLLETAGHARARAAELHAVVHSVCFSKEPRPYVSGYPSTSRGLQEVVRRSIEERGGTPADPVWVVSDQNGEPYRALDWGHAIVGLRRLSARFAEPVQWYPAVSFGDTGAASGGVALCAVARAFARGYSPSSAAIVLSAADGPLRAAALLSGPKNQPHHG